MPRLKTLPDAELLAATRQLFAAGGEKAVSFGNLSRATGLAASTLAQRFGTVEQLQAAAARSGWAVLEQALDEADHASQGKGATALLKALEDEAGRIPDLLMLGRRMPAAAEDAALWQARVVTALTFRIGQGDKARQSAQILFAAWQGRLIWRMGEPKLKDLVKRLG